jgi:hypothetical protein
MLPSMSTHRHALLIGQWLAVNMLAGATVAAVAVLHLYLFAAAGLVGGVVQLLVLRSKIPSSRAWVIASALGVLLGLVVGAGVWFVLSMTMQVAASPILGASAVYATNLFVPVGGGAAGVVVGLLQARAARLARGDKRAWLGWTALAFGLLAPLWWLTLPVTGSSPTTEAAKGAVQGLLYAAITAVGLCSLTMASRTTLADELG